MIYKRINKLLEPMCKIFIITALFFVFPMITFAQMRNNSGNAGIESESEATAIAKISLELCRIELKADSTQIYGIINMLVSEKKQLGEAENSLPNLAKGSRNYIKRNEEIKIYRTKIEYLINTINKRYAAVVGFHISDVTSFEELSNLQELITARRRVSLLKKYKQQTLDYINGNY